MTTLTTKCNLCISLINVSHPGPVFSLGSFASFIHMLGMSSLIYVIHWVIHTPNYLLILTDDSSSNLSPQQKGGLAAAKTSLRCTPQPITALWIQPEFIQTNIIQTLFIVNSVLLECRGGQGSQIKEYSHFLTTVYTVYIFSSYGCFSYWCFIYGPCNSRRTVTKEFHRLTLHACLSSYGGLSIALLNFYRF